VYAQTPRLLRLAADTELPPFRGGDLAVARSDCTTRQLAATITTL
jgi:hypothetical protein